MPGPFGYYYSPRQHIEFAKSELWSEGFSNGIVGYHFEPGVIANMVVMLLPQESHIEPRYGHWVGNPAVFTEPGSFEGYDVEDLTPKPGTWPITPTFDESVETYHAYALPVPNPRSSNQPYGSWTRHWAVYPDYTHTGGNLPVFASAFMMHYNILASLMQSNYVLNKRDYPVATVHVALLQNDGYIEFPNILGVRIDLIRVPPNVSRDSGIPMSYHAGWVTFGVPDHTAA